MAVFYVTSADNDGAGSLREAIQMANAADGEDTVDLSMLPNDAVIRLSTQISITDTVEIAATPGQGVIITGDSSGDDTTIAPNITDGINNENFDDNTRLFLVGGDETGATFTNLILTGGYSNDGQGGAAVRHTTGPGNDLYFNDTDLIGNHAYTGRGGAVNTNQAVFVTGFARDGVAFNMTSDHVSPGGAIASSDKIVLYRTNIEGNRTVGDNSPGGALYTIQLQGANFSLIDNHTLGTISPGGAAIGTGGASLQNATIALNGTYGAMSPGGAVHAVTFGGDHITFTNNSTHGEDSPGGGVYAELVFLENSIGIGNYAYMSPDNTDEIVALPNNLLLFGNNLLNRNVTPADSIFANTTTVGHDTTGSGEFNVFTSILAGEIDFDSGRIATVTLLADPNSLALDRGTGTRNGDFFDVDGDRDLLEDLPVDIRGLNRDVDIDGVPGTPDIGAFELQRFETESLNLVVTTSDDELDALHPDATLEDFGGLADLSLREALVLANFTTEIVDTVTFDPAIFTGGSASTIRLDETLGEIEIRGPVTIDGTGISDLLITGDAAGDDTLTAEGTTDIAASQAAGLLDDNSRVFNITNSVAETTLMSLTLTGGYTDEIGQRGGGIRSAAPLTLEDTTVTGNGTNSAFSAGGGIFGSVNIILNNSTVSGNQTSGDNSFGGGLFSTLGMNIADSTISGNATMGDNSFGGGLATYGSLVMNAGAVENNTTSGAESGGGGVLGQGNVVIASSTIAGNSTSGDDSGGGGIQARGAQITVVNSTVSGNGTSGDGSHGGGIDANGSALILNSTIHGNTVSGDANGGGVAADAAITAVQATVTGNLATDNGASGGGLYGATGVAVSNSIVLGNLAGTPGEAEIGVSAAPDSDIATEFQNIVGADSLAFDTTGRTNVINADPALVFAATATSGGATFGVLADNGGALETVGLRNAPENPAIDAGSDLAPFFLAEATLGIDVNQDGDKLDTLDRVDELGLDSRGTGLLRTIDQPNANPVPDFPGANTVDLGAFEFQGVVTENTPPEAANDAGSTDQFTPIFGLDVLANDSDGQGDPLTISEVGDASFGRAFIAEGGQSIDYAPFPDFFGTDTFTYTISDGRGGTDQATVELTVAEQDEDIVCALIVAYLYEAAFNRFPDVEGLNFWIDQALEVGLSKEEIASFFLTVPEFENLFGPVDELTDQELVEQLFLNTLDRPGEQAGVDFWVGVLADPDFSRADMLLAFAQSPENVLGSPNIATLEEVAPSEWDFVA